MLNQLIDQLKGDLGKMSKLEVIGLITTLVGLLGVWALKGEGLPITPGPVTPPPDAQQPPTPADVPDPPHVQNLRAEKVGAGRCRLSWSNPMVYSHIYINLYKNGQLLKTAIYPVWLDGTATTHTLDGLEPGSYRFEFVSIAQNWHGCPEAYGYTGVEANMG